MTIAGTPAMTTSATSENLVAAETAAASDALIPSVVHSQPQLLQVAPPTHHWRLVFVVGD